MNPSIDKPRRRTDLGVHPLDDEALVYDAARNATCRLNSTALFIWQRCDGTQTCDAIADELVRVWDAPLETVRADVRAAISQLQRHKLIELGPAKSP